METVLQIAAVCLVGAVLAAVLRQRSPETALLLGLAVCAAAGALLLRGLADVLDMLEDLAAAQPTRKATVQDVPDKEDLAAVHFVLEDGSEQTLFVYPEKDKWYIERPYEGVYETDQLLWVMVTDLSE